MLGDVRDSRKIVFTASTVFCNKAVLFYVYLRVTKFFGTKWYAVTEPLTSSGTR